MVYSQLHFNHKGTSKMTQELNLDDLLAQDAELQKKIAEARKSKKDQAIKDVVAIIKKYAITVKDLSGAFGFEPPAEPLKKKVVKKAKPKYQYQNPENPTETVFWSGRGSEATRPKSLVKLLETKKITIEQFKKMPEYQYKG